MENLRFEKSLVPSVRFAPGVWAVTRWIENDQVFSVELGWKDAGAAGDRYRQIGMFEYEPEAMFAIKAIEGSVEVRDVKETISDAGFVRYEPTGLSHGRPPYILKVREGALSVLLDFNVDGVRLYLGFSEGIYRTVEIGTLQLWAPGTRLAALGQPEAVATAVLCALLKARIEAEGVERPYAGAGNVVQGPVR
ncbi:hypothetical protein ACVIGB_000732 [Bradyrhizobium sp. USDA 4341]